MSKLEEFDIKIPEGLDAGSVSKIEIIARGKIKPVKGGGKYLLGDECTLIPKIVSKEFCEQRGLCRNYPHFAIVKYNLGGRETYDVWRDEPSL